MKKKLVFINRKNSLTFTKAFPIYKSVSSMMIELANIKLYVMFAYSFSFDFS